MSELERTVTAGAAERVIRSYVGTKSERAALAALSRLLMDSDPLAIPVRPLSQLNLSQRGKPYQESFVIFFPHKINLKLSLSLYLYLSLQSVSNRFYFR
jgi:hypothetical protein